MFRLPEWLQRSDMTIEELQADLDEFMAFYNERRTNQGKRCEGRTPMQTFTQGLPLCERYVQQNSLASVH